MRKIFSVFTLFATVGFAQADAIPSLNCSFTEPFISVLSFSGGVKFSTPEGFETASNIDIAGTNELPKISATIGAGRITLEIQDKPGSDGMSDLTFPLTGLLTLPNEKTPLQGGCTRLPDGTTPRPIKTKTPQKPVGVRKGPSLKSAWVANLFENQLFWAYPEDVVKGWVRGATSKTPQGGSGKISVVDGYVRLKFLGMLK